MKTLPVHPNGIKSGSRIRTLPKPDSAPPDGAPDYPRKMAEALQLPKRSRNEAILKVAMDALGNSGQLIEDGRHEWDATWFLRYDTSELIRVNSDYFKSWFSDLLAVNRATHHWQHIYRAVENASIGPNSLKVTLEAYWASRPGAIYLSNGPGEMARVTPNGTTMVPNGTDGVLFPQGRNLARWSLTTSQDPSAACRAFRDMAADAEHTKLLVLLWWMTWPTALLSKPPLVITGPIGSGKTKLAASLATLMGLDHTCRCVTDSGELDFWVAFDAGGMLTMDNCDVRTKWLVNGVEAAATGAIHTTRRLYTNSGEVAHHPRAWLALTSAIPSFGSAPALADRVLVARLQRREGPTDDDGLTTELLANRDAALSWLCDAWQLALADNAPTPAELNARHPTWAAWAVRLARAIGREKDAIAALQAAERDKATFNIENDILGDAIQKFVERTGRFEGTAKELLDCLQAGGDIDPDSKWTPKGVAKRLAAIWTNLEKVVQASQHKDRTRMTRYTFTPRDAECADFKSPILETF